MKKYISILILSVFNYCLILAQSDSTKSNFDALLDTCNLEFKTPDKFVEVTIKKNRDLSYQFAIKHSEKDYEIRYSIFPLYRLFPSKKDSSVKIVNRNNFYKGLLYANILNLSGDPKVKIQIKYFQPEAVHNEFQADIGGVVTFPLHSEYGQGYSFCTMTFLHKDNVADIFITGLFNPIDKSELNELMMGSFNSLKFKK
jgi:hypothetical protein